MTARVAVAAREPPVRGNGLNAGATTSFGFIGSSGATNAIPSATCTAR